MVSMDLFPKCTSVHTIGTFTDRFYCLTHRSDKLRFEYAFESTGKVQLLRVIQEHSGPPEVDVKYLNCTEIPYQWTRLLCHSGSSYGCRSMIEEGLFAGGLSNQRGRQACFFAAVDRMNKSTLYPACPNGTRLTPYNIKRRPHHDA